LPSFLPPHCLRLTSGIKNAATVDFSAAHCKVEVSSSSSIVVPLLIPSQFTNSPHIQRHDNKRCITWCVVVLIAVPILHHSTTNPPGQSPTEHNERGKNSPLLFILKECYHYPTITIITPLLALCIFPLWLSTNDRIVICFLASDLFR